MPWQEFSKMSLRLEFVRLALQQSVPFRELCRRFQISAPTGYKWLDRYDPDDAEAMCDQSRRPHSSPTKTTIETEQAVVCLRKKQPTWGGRKIAARLQNLGSQGAPAPSTITNILRRNDLLEAQGDRQKSLCRFEHEAPNDLWQMDFKGHFLIQQGRCHPLTILDDHSRYCIAVRACSNEQSQTVRAELTHCFRQHGLPRRILMDNGPTWSSQGRGITKIEAWLARLDVRVSHGRPGHPQTQGKEERFHRTLKADVLQFNVPHNLSGCQKAFDAFRTTYNHERPHEALNMKPPISRYTTSPRSYPETLPEVEYAPQDIVRKVSFPGQIRFKGRRIIVGRGIIGEHVAIRPTLDDGIYDVVYCTIPVRQIDLNDAQQEL